MLDDDDDDVRLMGDEKYYFFGIRTISPMPMANADRTWHGWRRGRMDLGASALRPGGRCQGHGVGLPSDGRRRGGFLCGGRERGGIGGSGARRTSTGNDTSSYLRTDPDGFFMVDFLCLMM